MRPIKLSGSENSTQGSCLEPDRTGTIPRANILACGHLCHVELNGAWMSDFLVGNEAKGTASLDSSNSGCRAHLEAAEVDAVHICYAMTVETKIRVCSFKVV